MSISTSTITDGDLMIHKFAYTVEQLEPFAETLCIRTMLSTQRLTEDFVNKWCLDQRYMFGFEDRYFIDINYVMKRQPHLDRSKLIETDEDDEDDS